MRMMKGPERKQKSRRTDSGRGDFAECLTMQLKEFWSEWEYIGEERYVVTSFF